MPAMISDDTFNSCTPVVPDPAFMSAPEAIRELAIMLGDRRSLQVRCSQGIERAKDTADGRRTRAELTLMHEAYERQARALGTAIKALS